ncbi:stage V sporulation protein AA, partial [Brevibacillus parabrevis]
MKDALFLRLRKRLAVKPEAMIALGDICQLFWDGEREEALKRMPIYQVKPTDGNLIVIDIMQVIQRVRSVYPEVELEIQGSPQIIVEVLNPRKKANPVLVAG